MLHFVKQAFKRFLQKKNLKLVFAPPGTLGYDFKWDLKHLVGKENPVCLDIGANEGQTVKLLLETFQKPVIHAFEPSESIFAILRSNSFPASVTLHKKALGATVEKKEFITFKNTCLSSFLELDTADENRFRDAEVQNREIVELETVDAFVARNNIPFVDVLKIDTQGFDLEVLKGAQTLFSEHKVGAVFIELNFVKMYQGQSTSHEIVHFLEQNGFFLVDYYDKIRQKKTLAWCSALFVKR